MRGNVGQAFCRLFKELLSPCLVPAVAPPLVTGDWEGRRFRLRNLLTSLILDVSAADSLAIIFRRWVSHLIASLLGRNRSPLRWSVVVLLFLLPRFSLVAFSLGQGLGNFPSRRSCPGCGRPRLGVGPLGSPVPVRQSCGSCCLRVLI